MGMAGSTRLTMGAGALVQALACCGLLNCAPDVNPLDYGCTPIWVRDAGTCLDEAAFAESVQSALWAQGDEAMGFAFAAGDLDGVALKGACGLARTAKDGGVRVFEPDMGIESGSTSKMLTTVAALQAVAQGAGNDGLSAAMVEFLPRGWEPHTALADAGITLKDLMQHRSGIVNTGGIGLRPVLQEEEWFEASRVGWSSYANHNIDAVGFMSVYLNEGSAIREIESSLWGSADYDADINLAVRDIHYELLREGTLRRVGIEADCIRFAADGQKVWLYKNAKDQRGFKLPARTNCMTSGFLLSAPEWVEWGAALERGELLDPASLTALDSWGDASDALGWSSEGVDWRAHSGGYSPSGVGVRTGLVVRREGLIAAVVSNSKNAGNGATIARAALDAARADCD